MPIADADVNVDGGSKRNRCVGSISNEFGRSAVSSRTVMVASLKTARATSKKQAVVLSVRVRVVNQLRLMIAKLSPLMVCKRVL